jgi:hypothetical protein
MVMEEVVDLPVPFTFRESQVEVDDMNRSFGRIHDGELSTSRFARVQAERDLVLRNERPAREQEVAVTTGAEMHVELEEVRDVVKGIGQEFRLVVEAGATDVTIDFLKTDDVRVFGLDDVDDSIEAISSVTAANPFMDVVTQEPHASESSVDDGCTPPAG